jgi:hypothetical protein
MKCLRNRSALTSFTLLLLVQMVAASCASDSVENTMSCEAAFYEAVDAGSVVSVNGLAIEADFSAFFVTELLDGHARIVTRQCMGDDFAIAVPVFPPNEFQDYQPTLSLDGERLCFTSTRPITGNIAVRQNVWCATRASQWQDAAPITALISPFWDGHAIEVEPLTLLYASERANDGQMVDIFEYDLRSGSSAPQRVEQLSTSVTDNDLAFDRHSQTLAMSRYDPATKDIDIYLSFSTERGWSTPVKPPSLASPDWEMSPAFTPDGKYLLYKLGHEPFRRVLVSEIISSSVR